VNEYSLLTDRNLFKYTDEIRAYETLRRLKAEEGNLVGLNSGEAILRLVDMQQTFGVDYWGGIFYHNGHKTGENDGVRQQIILVPIDRSREKSFWLWAHEERLTLAKKWGVSKVAMSMTGRFYDSATDQFVAASPIKRSGGVLCYPEDELGNEITMACQSKRFMLFLDIDEKIDDRGLIRIANGLKVPFLAADSGRGEHLTVPFLFEGRDELWNLFEKVHAIALLACLDAGVRLDLRHFAYSLFFRERSIRISEGLNGSAAPTVTGVIWPGKDGNI
jgi:hypothetical protein